MKVNIPLDNEWKQERQQRWDDVWESALRVIGISKKEKKIEDEIVRAQQEWYVNGNLQPLIESTDSPHRTEALDMPEVMRLCPIVNVGEYIQFFQEYALWASEHNVSYWGIAKDDRNVRFYKSFFRLYLGEHDDSTAEIYGLC